MHSLIRNEPFENRTTFFVYNIYIHLKFFNLTVHIPHNLSLYENIDVQPIVIVYSSESSVMWILLYITNDKNHLPTKTRNIPRQLRARDAIKFYYSVEDFLSNNITYRV